MPSESEPPAQEPVVIYSKKFDQDIKAITAWFEENVNEEMALHVTARILFELDQLSVTPMLGYPTNVSGLDQTYREWLILDKKYKVYFKRLTPNSILILRIRGAKGRPFGSKEIKP